MADYIVTDSGMRTNFTRITLLAPGCFSALSSNDDTESQHQREEVVPELNDSSAVATGTRTYEQALAKALHQNVPDLGALPIAQHRFLIDAEKEPPRHCVCAELIHFQADKDNARLLPMQSLAISDDESNQLLHALNDLIRGDGMEVIRVNQNSYYLTGMPATYLDTWPAHAVANGKIADYLPRNSEAGDWRRLLTEIQMLFHSHPVNDARVNNRQLAINGMWFWGGARVSQYTAIDSVQLIATDAYACGLSRAIGLQAMHPSDFNWTPDTTKANTTKANSTKADSTKADTAKSDNSNSELVIVDMAVYDAWLRGDHAALLAAKQVLHDQWIASAQNAVANGMCGEFILDGCEGHAIIEKPKQSKSSFSFKQFSLRKLFSSRKRQ